MRRPPAGRGIVDRRGPAEEEAAGGLPGLRLRDARDGDADGLIALIASCFAEYPGCVLDVDREEPDLRAIATAYAARGGRFWVVEGRAGIVGSAGAVPSAGGDGIELRKLYVARSERRRGLGTRLCALVEAEARARGSRFVELWSDSRFLDAHRLYERLGFRRRPETRELHDLSRSVELRFIKPLPPPAVAAGGGAG